MIIGYFPQNSVTVEAAQGSDEIAVSEGTVDATGGAISSGPAIEEEEITSGEIIVKELSEFQSNHEYSNETDVTWIYKKDNVAELKITFSEDTEMENGADYIYIYDANDNLIKRYTGTTLAGTTIDVLGDTVKVRLVSDSSNTAYGFSVVDVVCMNELEVHSTPTTSKYLVGQDVDYTGFSLVGKYDDGTEREIQSGYTFSDVDNSVLGNQKIDVSYYGLKTSFEITYVKPTLVSLEVSVQPTKTTFVYYEEFSYSGLVLKAIDSEGEEYLITTGYKVSGYDKSIVGTQTVVVEYEELATSYNVVVENAVTYTVSSGKATVTGVVDSTIDTIIIPEKLDGYTVTAVGASALKNNKKVIKVSLPDTVTSIGNYAFSGCINLQKINFPQNLVTIGGYAYAGCKGIEKIEVPGSVTSIGEGAFGGCKLKEIVLPFVGKTKTATGSTALFGYIFGTTSYEGTKRIYQYYNSSSSTGYYISSTLSKVTITGASQIPYGAFYGCSNLVEINLNEGITSVGSRAFYGCSKLQSMTIPESVTSIEDYAFYNCSKMTSVNIPDGVKKINSYVFYGNSALEKITLPLNVASIGDYAFYGCEKMSNVVLPKGLTTIGNYAFQNCTNFTEVEFPETLTSIGNCAYAGCKGIEKIEVPGSVTSIGEGAFGGCKLKEIVLPFVGKTKTATGSTALFGYIFGTTSYEGTKRIYQYYNSSSSTGYYISSTLSKVTITGASQIPYGAFYGCSNLVEINLNEGITKIDDKALYNCTSLKKLYLPDSLESVGEKALYGCTKVYIYAKDGTVAKEYATNNGIESYESAKIELDKSNIILYRGENAVLVPTVTMLDGQVNEEAVISWESSDTSIVEVENGMITVVNPGSATITATCEGHEAICNVNVYYKLEGIEFEKAEYSVDINETSSELNVLYNPGNTTDERKLSWTSSDESIATVDENGVVTGVTKGEVTITAYSQYGYETACKINVLVPITQMSLSEESIVINKGESYILQETVLPSNTTDEYEWESVNEAIATVDDSGKVTAISAGTTRSFFA